VTPRIDVFLTVTILAALAIARGGAARAQELYGGHYEQQSGEDLYEGICQGCHMPDAKGAVGAGAYPALAGNARLMSSLYAITVVLNGQRAMPPFGAALSDAQIADVVNYIRTHFGNHYTAPVPPADVKAARRREVR
jgi:mono/diheme cytochrome c family protein